MIYKARSLNEQNQGACPTVNLFRTVCSSEMMGKDQDVIYIYKMLKPQSHTACLESMYSLKLSLTGSVADNFFRNTDDCAA